MESQENIENNIFYLPLINFKMPAGFPSPAMDNLEERINLIQVIAPHPFSTFLFYSEGKSMLDACIPPGSLLVVDKSLTAISGDIIIAHLDGKFTVKYINFQDKKCFLVPANKSANFPTIEVTEEMEMMVWGVVTNVIINTKNIRLCTLW